MDSGGYVRVRADGDPGAYRNAERLEHMVKAEKAIGRRLLKTEVVHHLDECRTNNRLDNLAVMRRADHFNLHIKANRLRRAGDPDAARRLLAAVPNILTRHGS